MGIFSGPEEGTSTLEKRQRSIKMKGTLTVEFQMELQKGMLREKKVLPQRFFLKALIAKDIRNNFTKIYELLEFGLRSVSGERDHWNTCGRNHPSTLKLES